MGIVEISNIISQRMFRTAHYLKEKLLYRKACGNY